MESEIQSTLQPPIYQPTLAQFINFKEFIHNLEKQKISFAKVSILFLPLNYSPSFQLFFFVLELTHFQEYISFNLFEENIIPNFH